MKRTATQYRTKHRQYKPPDYDDLIYLVLAITIAIYGTYLSLKAPTGLLHLFTNH